MTEGLFDLGDEPEPRDESVPARARDEQVQIIRNGLDDAGLVSQDDRREFVESVILSEVSSLRALTALQARRVIDRLKTQHGASKDTDGSAWDNRERDTWIDKM
ncbi:hypothetical protein [Aeromicrobium wangtongii]|uniref:Uncharacterized protein n=1 Tax=Aeromicrobium wangtongii TaxID=2969247 RepID=A0ABY5M6E8_9ACTN|nr:hypothetical protein [Aeromicrobium wangtongii]MCD9198325.1 hypothetical protein [Aeromicrobium wangtongii]UUP12357.1 hypothetical protein NQV15_10870 [Aeromicrobium wangtongii]